MTEFDFDLDEDVVPRRPASLVELPLSPQQRRWWHLCATYPDAMSPMVFLIHRLRGPLDVDAWTRAVGAVVDRHEVLRTRFLARDGGAVQVVEPAAGLPVERIDLTDLPASEREERARELLNARREVRMDLERGPLVQSCLIRLADDDVVWALTIHHILADGASLAIIDRELSLCYRAYVAGTEPALGPLDVQYGDFAVWHAATRESRYEDDLDYWLDQLGGVPTLDLRTDLPRPAEKKAPAADVVHELDADLAARVVELARDERSTQFMVLVAALGIVLGRYSGQEDFAIGVPVVGGARARAELEPLVGIFANTLALRTDLSGDPSFRTLVAATRETMIDALDHQEIPFSRVVAELGIPHDPSRTQVVQVLFLFDEFDVSGEVDVPGVRVEDFPLAVPKILHDLMVYAWPTPSGLTTRFAYDTGLFKADTVAEMANTLEHVLRQATADPTRHLSQL